ncbi:MAG: response regulator [Oscillospiraceae bacterium]|nr:response regulator [Oscillospiraceae bacterium]
MKILVADDQQRIVEDIIFELEDLLPGAKMIGTSEPENIIPLCEKEKFDVVFIDIEMPGANGIDIAKKLLEMNNRLNVIYITGYDKYALDSYETVASAFLLKPINTAKIRKAMDNLRFPVSDITDDQIEAQYSGAAVIGKKIEKYRKERDLTRNELAELVDVAMPTVYRWENGDRLPDIVTLMKIARILGVKYDKFMSDDIGS